MNIKSLKDLIEKIPENFSIPEDDKSDFFIQDKKSVIELRKARWLYRELGEFLVYNITSLSTPKSRVDIYNEEVYYDELQKDKYICKQISEIYAKALNMIGIKALTIEHKQGYDVNHVGTVFELSNGMQFYADLTLDLINIKTGMRTREFGNSGPVSWVVQNDFGHNPKDWVQRFKKNIEILNNSEIEKYIDIPVVKYKVFNMYTESYFERLLEEMQNEELIKEYIVNLPEDMDELERNAIILKYKFEFILRNLRLDELDYLTGRDFIKEAIPNVFLAEEQKNFYWFNTNRVVNIETEEKEFGACFLLDCGEKNYYYFYKQGKIPEALEAEEFMELVKKEDWQLPKLRKKDALALGIDFEK